MRLNVIIVAGIAATCCAPALADESPTSKLIEASVNRSLPAIAATTAEYPHKVQCFSCHHQGVAGFGLSVAKFRGYAVDADIKAIVELTQADLRHDLKMYTEGDGQPGGVTRAGYALLALNSCGVPPDDLTKAVTNWMLRRDTELGWWKARSNRPPGEFSNFTDTFLAVQALRSYGDNTRKSDIDARIAKALTWLEQTSTKETEDRVFRLWGLKAAGAPRTELDAAAKELLAAQQPDGGWAQLPGGSSDAYATATVLTSLRESGVVTAADAAYERGAAYLIKQQLPDGTWHVTTRSRPVQPYFESGFPHGKDQFISMAATGWAIAALCFSDEVHKKP